MPRLEQLFQAGLYAQVIKEASAYLEAEGQMALKADECTWLAERSQRIISLLTEARAVYKTFDYQATSSLLNVALGLNSQDTALHAFHLAAISMEEAQGYYAAGDFTKAREKALVVKGITAVENANVADRFVQKVDLCERSHSLITRNPDEALKAAEKIIQIQPKDCQAMKLIEEISAVIIKRNQILSEARKLMTQNDFSGAKELYLSVFSLGPEVRQVCQELSGVLDSMNKQGQFDIVFAMATQLLKDNPSNESFRDARSVALGNITLKLLIPHNNIIGALLTAIEHRQRRIRNAYGGFKYLYSSCAFGRGEFEDTFVVRGLRMKTDHTVAALEGITVRSKDVARVGDSFVFLDFNAEPVTDDYFEVAGVNGEDNSIVFRFDNIEQKERAQQCIRAKGFIKKVEDTSLIRQKEAFDSVITELQGSISRGRATTGNNFLDILFGLKKDQANKPKDDACPSMSELVKSDPSQKMAVLSGISNEPLVTLIQGPPGTGKTTTISDIVRHYILKGNRVLAVSQSNAAVNNIGERLKRSGIAFVRVGNQEEKVSDEIKDNWHNREKYLCGFEQEYAQKHSGFVVLGTNNGFLNDKFIRQNGFFRRFDVVIVEEAGRATIAETIVPMLMAQDKVILVGDHMQLPAFGVSQDMEAMVREEAAVMTQEGRPLEQRFSLPSLEEMFSPQNLWNFKVSLFQRAFELERDRGITMDRHLLRVNRRSHPLIAGLVNIFYDGQLLTRDHDKEGKEIAEEDTLKLIDVAGREAQLNTSSYNLREAGVVLRELEEILNQENPEGGYRYGFEDITIISPYSAQNEELILALRLRSVIDKIRSGNQQDIKLTNDEKAVLRRSLKVDIDAISNMRTRSFIANFIANPYPSSLHAFLRLVKFDVSLHGRRLFSNEDVHKIHIMVNTIDAIQGQENKVVIVSMVRSKSDTGEEFKPIGFLETMDGLQRINVSLSRAKEKLIVIGDFTNTLCRAQGQEARDKFVKIVEYVKQGDGSYIKIGSGQSRINAEANGNCGSSREQGQPNGQGKGFFGNLSDEEVKGCKALARRRAFMPLPEFNGYAQSLCITPVKFFYFTVCNPRAPPSKRFIWERRHKGVLEVYFSSREFVDEFSAKFNTNLTTALEAVSYHGYQEAVIKKTHSQAERLTEAKPEFSEVSRQLKILDFAVGQEVEYERILAKGGTVAYKSRLFVNSVIFGSGKLELVENLSLPALRKIFVYFDSSPSIFKEKIKIIKGPVAVSGTSHQITSAAMFAAADSPRFARFPDVSVGFRNLGVVLQQLEQYLADSGRTTGPPVVAYRTAAGEIRWNLTPAEIYARLTPDQMASILIHEICPTEAEGISLQAVFFYHAQNMRV